MSKQKPAKTNTKAFLTQGLPSRIRLTLDWDGACDLSADRRNCIIHRALLHKEEITRPSVGLDKITFIWRGDARIEIIPDAHSIRAILQNDEAAQGERPWPTGQQVIYLSMDQISVYDLRPDREYRRKLRDSEEFRAADRAYHASRREANPEYVREQENKARAARKKKKSRQVPPSQRGRFVLS